MSVYLSGGSVLLDAGSVAIDAACCCGGGGPCGPGTCCGFLNPDDGLYYQTRISHYNYTKDFNCPADGLETGIRFSDGVHVIVAGGSVCSTTGTGAPCKFISHCDDTESVIERESYDSDCNLNITNRSYDIFKYGFVCNPDHTAADFLICSPDVILRLTDGFPDCSIAIHVCSQLAFDHYTYEDLCLNVCGACCDFDNSTCELTLESDCLDPRVYLGDGTTCPDCGF